MRIKPAIGSAVGQTDASHWGQVYLSPNAYGVVEIHDPESQARRIGVELLTRLQYKITSEVISLKDLASIIRSVAGYTIKTIAVVIPVGNIAYIVLQGSGRIYLKRGEKLATLIDGEGAISGELQVNDTLLIVSKSFADAIAHEQLVTVFDHAPPREVAEKLTLMLHESESGVGAAAVVFQVNDIISIESENEAVREEPPPEPKVPVLRNRGSFWDKIRKISPGSLVERIRRKEGKDRKKSMLGVLVIVTVMLFIASVLIGVRKQAIGAEDQKASAAMKDASFMFEEGTALMELNAIKGRERLAEAKAMLEPYLDTTSEKSVTGRELRELYANVTANLSQAMKIYEVSPEIFYDMSFLKKDAVASAIATDGTTMGILDRTSGTVYEVIISTKSGKMLASGGDLTGSAFIAMDKDAIYVAGETGITEINPDEKTPQRTIAKPEKWQLPAAMAVFDGNIYVLDTAAGRIWKYVPTESGFSDTREYLNPDSFPDLSGATSMSVDGSVWVGTRSVPVLKFTQGREDTIVLRGVDPPFSGVTRFFTDDSVNNLYILEPQNRRIVVLLKDGTYLAQYTWDQPLDIVDFAVSESERKILLLTEGKIFAVPLQ